jgi:hypothetical protein
MPGFQSKKAAASAKVFDREEAIDYLSESDFQYIMSGDGCGLELLRTYLEDGFKGYGNFTDEELIAEVAQHKEMNNA